MKIIEGKDSQQLDVRIRFDSEEEKQAAFRLLAAMHQKLIGLQRDKEYLLRLEDVCFIASSDKRTFLYTAQGCYESMLWLYQMEEQQSNNYQYGTCNQHACRPEVKNPGISGYRSSAYGHKDLCKGV